MSSGFFSDPINNDDNLNFSGNGKVWEMAKECGVANIRVTSYEGQGIEVYYAPTGRAHRWSWKNKEHGWMFANDRRQHLGFCQSGGHYKCP